MGVFDKKGSKVRWSNEAKERLERIPFFVRPFIKKRAEEVTRERGLDEVTPEILAQLRKTEHTGG
ncbi:MAG: PCP reductase family protein [Deltaproteobacteria bacterium]|nr:PCP reductase family protein [Deltaproteobacteria bacterium]